jgi:hypothetical protein
MDTDREWRVSSTEHLCEGRGCNSGKATWSGTAFDPIFGARLAMKSPHLSSAITVDREPDSEVEGLQRSTAMSVRVEWMTP